MTPQQELILEAIADGLDPDEAADVAGVSRDVLRNWKALADGATTYRDGARPSEATVKAATEFYLALPRAAAMGKRALLEKLRHNAMTPNPRTGWYDTQAIDKILSKSAFRSGWYEHRTTTIEHQSIPPAHTVVRELSDAELLALPDGESE